MLFRWALAGLFPVLGCSASGSASHDAGRTQGSPVDAGVPDLCSRPAADAVHDVFCDGGLAGVGGLLDLESRLGVHLGGAPDAGGAYDDSGASAYDAPPLFTPLVLLGHSTALFGRLVSPINPRAILLGDGNVVAFNRGVQEVEIASLDRGANLFNFYLVSFEQACNAAPGGCTPGDRFTPRIESGWTSVRIQDAEELKNTPFDCRECHQRARGTPMLLMRELQGPWPHFFLPDDGEPPAAFPEATGADLLHDYLRAKGDEGYAGVPTEVLRSTIGETLEDSVLAAQPLLFDGTRIASERWPYDADAGYAATPQRSPTWYAAYDAFKRGEELPLPYFAPRPTDPGKQATLAAAYEGYRNGQLDAGDLPDLGDIYPDDPQVRAEIGLQTEPGATPAQTLVQACGQCHDDVLDQSLSRARFNVALARMGRAELDVAIARLQAPRSDPGAMPPAATRQLDPNAIAPLVAYLRQDVRSPEDDALLEHASRVGMANGAPPAPTDR